MANPPIEPWHTNANSILSPIERVKDGIRDSISTIRAKWPEWERNNDGRWAWFTGAKKILQSYQLSSVCIRDHLSHAEWWKSRSFEMTESEIPEHLKEFSVLQLYGLSNGLFTITEESLRLIVSALDPNACNEGRSDFKNIYEFLLSRVGLEKHRALFDLHRLIRNTNHTNGVFRPRNGQDVTVVFDGDEYHFRNGYKLTFVNIGLVLKIVTSYNLAMLDVVSSSEVADLTKVFRFIEDGDGAIGEAT